MSKDLESAASDFHRLLAALHGFAAWFFGRRALRHYNEFKAKRGLIWLIAWCGFHLICAAVSFIASRIHTHDAH